MKIAFFNEHLLHWNGGVRFIHEVTKRLWAKHIDIDILVEKCSDDNWKRFYEAGPIVKEFAPKNNPQKISYWLFYPYYLIKNAQELKKQVLPEGYGCYISSSPTTHILCLLARIRPVLIVFELNPWLYSKEYRKGLSFIKRLVLLIGSPVAKLLEGLAYRNAKSIIVHSKYVQYCIKDKYNIDSIVVPVGVDSSFFNKVSNNSIYSTYSTYNVLLHIASYLSPMKGTKYAIMAMGMIANEIPNALLLIITSSELDTVEVRKLVNMAKSYGVEDNIRFVTDVPDKDMPAYYSMAKIHLQPSLDENAHYPAIEAGCCECPTITFNGRFVVEDVVDGSTGYVVPKYNTVDISKYAISLIKNPDLRSYIGRNAKQLMINKFSWDNYISKLQEVINEK